MERPLLYDALKKPASSCASAICSAIWLVIQRRNLGYGNFGLNYEFVVSQGQHWRIITSAFSHISFLYLVFNMSTVWSLSVVESTVDYHLGTAYYLRYSIILVFLSELMVLGMYHVFVTWFKIEYYRRVTTVGYSCIVFGWMTILAVKQPSLKLNFFRLLLLPISFAPFESLIFTSITIPHASFLGHLAEIIVGYLIGWDVVQGMTNYYAITFAFWIAIGFLWSLNRTTSFEFSYLKIESGRPRYAKRGCCSFHFIYKRVRTLPYFARK